VNVAASLAAKIPDARMVLLEGASPLWFTGDVQAVLRAIGEFLGEDEVAAAWAKPPEAGAFRTVLFTDVEGSTALTQRLGDARARDLLREHERMVREALKSHGGAEVKTMGDGFMASFSSVTRALECAIAMQRAFAEHNDSAQEPIRVRVGLNAGEPIAEKDPDGRSDLYGTAVNEAARITAAAKGGEILVADVVRQLAKGKDFLFADRGEVSLKGLDEPVRLYEVQWREEG
jgi:class 3 adenylate cyclase